VILSQLSNYRRRYMFMTNFDSRLLYLRNNVDETQPHLYRLCTVTHQIKRMFSNERNGMQCAQELFGNRTVGLLQLG
jgi:hypothetical protein